MKPSLILIFVMLFVVCRIPDANSLTPEEIAKKALDATVLLVMVDANGEVLSAGSGFFVQPNQIATNFHVIDGSTGGEAKPVGRNVVYSVERISAVDEKHDLAILQVSAPAIEPLSLGDSDSVAVGEKIYVTGNPIVIFEGTFSDGIISAIREVEEQKLFQVTAPISKGNSGGPVLNAKGEVIAVSVGTMPAGQNLNFAIPAIYLKALVDKLDGRKQVVPKVVPPKPKPPPPPSPQEMLEKGIEHYEGTQFTEAIRSLRSALHRLTDPKQRALAHLYLGCSKRGLGESDYSVSEEFEEALRHNPNQTLPPRIGEDHPVFKPLLEKVRSESTGKLTVTCSLPQTEIWIDGKEIERYIIGAGNATARLFQGVYSVEGVYERVSRKQTVQIEPDKHKELYLELPPILIHVSPARASVGEIIPLGLDLISRDKPKQVRIRYTIYDKHGEELDRGNQELQLRDDRLEMSMWSYHVDFPSQNHVGKIAYFITADEGRSPTSQYHEISIVDENLPIIDLLEPHEAAEFRVNQPITVRARVTDSTSIDEVSLHYAFSASRSAKPSETSPSMPLERESSTDTYIGSISPQQSTTGYIWYYLTATDEGNNEMRSAVRRIRIVDLTDNRPIFRPKNEFKATKHQLHQGVWVGHGWSQDTLNHRRFFSGWERGSVLSFSYLSEGKGYQTHGLQLDHSYQIPANINATVQWGPAMRESTIAFAFLGGVAGYKNADSGRLQPSWAGRGALNGTNQITPFVGASLKLYPLDTVTVDFTGSIRLRSVGIFSSGTSGYAAKHLHHYEMGVRVYITPTLNLKVGYGKWYLGDRDNSSVQFGLGVTF